MTTLLSTAVIENFLASDDSLKFENIRVIRAGNAVRASWVQPNGRELSHDLIPISEFGDVIDDVPETLFTVGADEEFSEIYPDGDVGQFPIMASGLTYAEAIALRDSFDSTDEYYEEG